jgi:cytochrome c oxidase subunit 1
LNVLSTAGATVLAVGFLLPAVYLIWSLKYGALAPADPWVATGLEWRTLSPPPTENFEQTPIVTWDAYEYRPSEEIETVGKVRHGDKPDRSAYDQGKLITEAGD